MIIILTSRSRNRVKEANNLLFNKFTVTDTMKRQNEYTPTDICLNFFNKFLEDTSYMCGATDIAVLDRGICHLSQI